MKCPRCAVDLSISDRQGVEIDFCPRCRGVWLERGELDKILERSGYAPAGAYYGSGAPGGPRPYRDDDDDDDDDRHRERRPGYGDGDHGQRRRKKSWLGEMFDF